MNMREIGQEQTLWVVEAWRALAAWMVVYAHLGSGSQALWGGLRFAFTGVDLFFVLSGFVFAPYLFGRPVRLRAFWVRRLFRIYPAFVLALAVYMALKWAQGGALLHVWEHLAFAYIQTREMAFYYNPVFWSLPSEVAFYLALPALGWACAGRPWRVALLLLLALAMRVVLGWASDRATGNTAFMAMHHLPGVLVEFVLGSMAWWLAQRPWLGTAQRCAFALAGLALWLALAHWFGQVGDAGIDAGWARGQLGWLAALAAAALVCASSARWGGAPLWLQQGALWAGQLSYGVYLFHTAALQVVQPLAQPHGPAAAAAAGVALTLAVAWLNFRLWENPLRQWGRRLGR